MSQEFQDNKKLMQRNKDNGEQRQILRKIKDQIKNSFPRNVSLGKRNTGELD